MYDDNEQKIFSKHSVCGRSGACRLLVAKCLGLKVFRSRCRSSEVFEIGTVQDMIRAGGCVWLVFLGTVLYAVSFASGIAYAVYHQVSRHVFFFSDGVLLLLITVLTKARACVADSCEKLVSSQHCALLQPSDTDVITVPGGFRLPELDGVHVFHSQLTPSTREYMNSKVHREFVRPLASHFFSFLM